MITKSKILLLAFAVFTLVEISSSSVTLAVPTISNVKVIDVTKSTARIVWDSSVTGSQQILYGPTTAYGWRSADYNGQGQTDQTHHVYWISGLASNTPYHFCPQTTDANGVSSLCDGKANDYVLTSGQDTPSEPELPRTYVDTSVPIVNGQTFTTTSDCSDLQAQINLAAQADGNKTHQVLIPAGSLCTGGWYFPKKSAGNGWIIVRTSTPDSQLPPPGTRINPNLQRNLLATIRDNSPWVFMGDVGAPCDGSWQWNGWTEDPSQPTFINVCDDNTKKLTRINPPSGSQVPANCTNNQWFIKTGETNPQRKAWLCIDGVFTNVTFFHINEAWSNSVYPALELKPGASHYRFIGLEITNVKVPSYGYRDMVYPALINVLTSNDHIIFDRMYIHGQGAPTKSGGAISLEGSHNALVDSVIDNFTTWRKLDGVDSESIGIGSSSGPGPIKIVNNYIGNIIGIALYTSDESDWKIPDPADYEIRNNYFYKDDKFIYGNPKSDGYYYDNRHFIELKRGQRYLIDGNIFEGNFGTLQQGAAVSFSNSAGYAATEDTKMTIRDITVRNNVFKRNPVNVIISGHLRGRPKLTAIVAQRFKFTNNLMLNGIGRYAVPGWGQNWNNAPGGGMFLIFNAPEDVNISHNTFYSPSLGLITFDQYAKDMAPGEGLIFQNNLSHFGSGINAQGMPGLTAIDGAWKRIPNRGWIFDHNVLVGPFDQAGINKVEDNPPDNFYVPSEASVGFSNVEAKDFSLMASSPYKNKGSDGKDPGVDWNALNAVIANVITGGSTSPLDHLSPAAPLQLRVK